MLDFSKIKTGVVNRLGDLMCYAAVEIVANLVVTKQQLLQYGEKGWNANKSQLDYDLKVAVWASLYKEVQNDLLHLRMTLRKHMTLGPVIEVNDEITKLINKLSPPGRVDKVNDLGHTDSLPNQS